MAQQAALQGEEKALVAQLGRLHEQVAEAQRALARKGAETVRLPLPLTPKPNANLTLGEPKCPERVSLPSYQARRCAASG